MNGDVDRLAAQLGSREEQLRARVQELESRERAYLQERTLLRATLAGLRSMLDDLPERIFWKDRELRFLGANRAFAADAGFGSSEELIGKSDFDCSWSAMAHVVRARDRVLLEERPLAQFASAVEGELPACRAQRIALRDGQGRVIGLLGYYTDPSDPAAAFQALKESEARYRTLIEQAKDGFFVADRDGIYLASNPALRAMLGYEEREMRGKHIRDFVDPTDLVQTPLRARALRAGKPIAAQRVLRRKDGSAVVTEIVANLLPDGTFEAVVRDVSERVRAEQERARLADELRHAQKMESIGRLAGGLAHDFNNLLLVILANAHVLQRRYGELVERELAGIVGAAERGGTLTRQLLAFSRKRVLKPVTLDLNDLLRGLFSMLERLMGEDIQLEFALADGPCRVLADPSQLEQVVMNLAVNARDACSEGGIVQVRTELAPSSQLTAAEEVVLYVADSGHGMDEATQSRIFEPFFTTKALGEGTGLGLSMVYGIVTQNGGAIAVKSAPGQGSLFEVRLPAAPEAEPVPPPSAAAPRPEYRPASILLVEDDAPVREALKTALTAAGFRVLTATSADEALALHRTRREQIEIVVSDVVMPSTSGLLLAEQLLTERPGLPILLMSGYSDKLFESGRWDERLSFLQKPFTPEQLTQRVRELLG